MFLNITTTWYARICISGARTHAKMTCSRRRALVISLELYHPVRPVGQEQHANLSLTCQATSTQLRIAVPDVKVAKLPCPPEPSQNSVSRGSPGLPGAVVAVKANVASRGVVIELRQGGMRNVETFGRLRVSKVIRTLFTVYPLYVISICKRTI